MVLQGLWEWIHFKLKRESGKVLLNERVRERETKKESFVKTEQIDGIGRDKNEDILDDDNISIIF